jgi:hypothetical protein
MLQLSPKEQFTIVRQLEDSSDSNTYYVKSVIRDAKTDDIIDTVYLTDKGTQRFSKVWEVCADPSGRGRFIVITSYVYSDAGYTTLSNIYAARGDTYLVETRWNYGIGGHGGGMDVSYKKIREIVQEEINKIPKTEVDFSDVLLAIKAIKPTNISDLEKHLEVIGEMIQKIKIPSVNLSPLLKELQSLQKDNGKLSKALSKALDERFQFLVSRIENLKEPVNLEEVKEPVNLEEVKEEVVKESIFDSFRDIMGKRKKLFEL